MYDVIIIGAGPAGLTAALYSLRNGKKVLVIEAESFGGQITLSPAVENYPATGRISGIEFSDKLMEQVEDLGCEIGFSRVNRVVDGNPKKVITEDSEFEAKAVIIATGVKHRKLGVSNEDKLIGKGISYCAVCDGAFYKGKTVAVVGGGSSALTDALYLSEICNKVYLIHRREGFRAEENVVNKARQKDNIELVLNATVSGLIGENALEGIEVSVSGERRVIETEALFVMIGMVADNSAFADVLDLDKDGYVISDESCMTKTPGVFVAGDCRNKKIRQLTTAVADGTASAVAAYEYLQNQIDE